MIGYFVPALAADGDDFSFDLDVEFDVFVFAGVFPRVSAMFMFNFMFHVLFLKMPMGGCFPFKWAV